MNTLTKMLHNYEKLIENPEKEFEKWKYYGSFDSCLLCKLFRKDGDCRINCPLFNMDEMQRITCFTDTAHEFENKIKYLRFFLNNQGRKKQINAARMSVKKLARARYKEIIKHLDKKGYIYG